MICVEEFIKIILFHLPVLVIPGPNLVLVIKNSMSGGIKNGLLTSCGICCGISLHIFYTLIFFATLSKQTFSKIENLKYLAVLYLVYIGYNGFVNSREIEFSKTTSSRTLSTYLNSFKDGFLIDILNPLIGMFYFLLWTSIKINITSLVNIATYGISSLIIIIIWFIFISFIFSRSNLVNIYTRYNVLIEKSTSIILIMFAYLLLLD